MALLLGSFPKNFDKQAVKSKLDERRVTTIFKEKPNHVTTHIVVFSKDQISSSVENKSKQLFVPVVVLTQEIVSLATNENQEIEEPKIQRRVTIQKFYIRMRSPRIVVMQHLFQLFQNDAFVEKNKNSYYLGLFCWQDASEKIKKQINIDTIGLVFISGVIKTETIFNKTSANFNCKFLVIKLLPLIL